MKTIRIKLPAPMHGHKAGETAFLIVGKGPLCILRLKGEPSISCNRAEFGLTK